MSKEILEAQVVYSSDQSSLKKLQLESEAVLKRLKDPIAIELTAKLGNLKQTKAELLNQISDLQKELKLQLKMEIQNPARIGELRSQLGGLRGEADMLGKVINRQNQNLNNFANTGSTELSKLGYYFQKLGIDINSGLGKALLGASNQMSQFGSSALGFLGGGAILGGMAYLGKEALFLADKLEQVSISFEVLTGSAEKSKSLLADLRQLAKESPTLELLSIRDTAKQLIAFGIDSESVVGTIKMLGDVSAATGVDISRIGYAYGQVRSAGRLYGTELRQFTEAGVPLLATLAKMYGVTEKSARKMVEDGKVSFNDMQSAFQKLTSEGGMMANMMSRQAETLSGKISKLKDEIAISMEEGGGAIIDFAKTGVDWTTWLFLKLKDSFAGMQMISTIFTAFFLDSMYAIQDSIKGVGSFFQKFGVAWTGIWSQAGDVVATWAINIGIAIDNIPYYIQNGLNKSLKIFSSFSNKIGDLQNKLAESMGLDPIAGKVDLSIDFGATKKEFESYNKGIIGGTFDQINAINLERKSFSDSMTEKRDINKVVLREQLTDIENANSAKANEGRKLNYELKKMAEDEEKTEKKKNRAKSNSAKEATEKQKKYYSDLISKRKENIKSIDTEIKKLKDGVKEIEAIEKKMQELITGAKGQTGDVVASRYRTLLEDKKSAEEALLDHQRSTDQSIYALDPAYQNNLNDINSQIAEIEQSGLLDQNTKAKEEQRASLSKTGQDRFDFQEALADIELKKSAEMEALKAEKIAVEARLGMKADEATKELALLEKRKSQNERQLKAYEDITKIIEKGITDATKQNIDARMVEYRKEEAKLNDLIRLRMMAGMAIPSPIAPVTTNNVTNAPTVNVNAQVAQNVDVNYLGQELSRQLLLSNKGIN